MTNCYNGKTKSLRIRLQRLQGNEKQIWPTEWLQNTSPRISRVSQHGKVSLTDVDGHYPELVHLYPILYILPLHCRNVCHRVYYTGNKI